MIGVRFGPYRILATLGAGGMGTVYRAEGPDGVIALKVVLPHLLESADALERFRREAAIGGTVRHPNVVATLGSGTEVVEGKTLHYLAMEYVEGRTLRDLQLEMRRMPEDLCRHIGREIAAGLAAIHAAGVVHRDIKPENVLVTRGHEVKVMDLGVARGADDAARVTLTGAFVGSLQYAAPEQFTGGGKGLDGRVDLHALGIVLHELATGTNPFEAEDWRDVFRRIVHDEPPRIGVLNPQISPFLEEVVATLLRKDREQRFPSAAALVDVLGRAEDGPWWDARVREIRASTRRPLRRIRVARETALAGRDEEIAVLRRQWTKAVAGEARSVVVTGEAGIGKSRLVDELSALLEKEGEDLHFLHGGFVPGAAGGAGALASAILGHFGAETLFEPLAAALASCAPLVPSFAAYLRAEAPPRGAPPLSADMLAHCIALTLRAVAAERPLLLLVEDVHFAAPAGRAAIAAVVGELRGARALVVATSRPTEEGAWVSALQRAAPLVRVDVPRLPQEAVHALLKDALRSDFLAAEIAPVLSEKSGGNPFFVLEILRGLREGRVLARDASGRWVATGDPRKLVVPSSIEDLVAARLAVLDPEDRALLETAACVGFEFDPALVAEAEGLATIPALERFAAIEQRHGLVRTAGRGLQFDHHQVRERMCEKMDPAARTRRHGAIAAALEARHAAHGMAVGAPLPGAASEELVRHLLRGPEPSRAAPHILAALDHATVRTRLDEALAMVDLATSREGTLSGEILVRTLMRGAGQLRRSGDAAAARRCWHRAVAAAEAHGDAGVLASALGGLAYDLVLGHEAGEAEQLLRRALDLVPGDVDPLVRRRMLTHLAIALEADGRHKEAETAYRDAIVLAERFGTPEDVSGAEVNLAGVLYMTGRFDAAHQILERRLVYCREVGDLAEERKALGNMGAILHAQGRFEEARRIFEEDLGTLRRLGDRHGEQRTLSNLGNALRSLGRYGEAIECYRRAAEQQQELSDASGAASELNLLGMASANCGDLAAARDCFVRAAGGAVAAGNQEELAWATYGLSRVASADGRDGAAVRLARAAVATAVATEDPDLTTKLRTHLAAVLARRGPADEARIVARAALLEARSMGSPACEAAVIVVIASLPPPADLAAEGVTDAERALVSDPAGEIDRLLARTGCVLDVACHTQVRLAAWRHSGRREHLDAAKSLMDAVLAALPEDARDRAVECVPVHREIVAALVVGR
ncbi:MAG: tetratricopeptide repeat protein [Planctomycetes bacterium]|nr:tetratricopeptide repeat protein [Planctomycetota bacterium]